MLLFLLLLGILMSCILLYFNARKFPSIIHLSLFVFSISLYGIMQYVMLYSKSVVLVAIFNGHFTFILYLTGPALYWYIRSVLSDNSRFFRKDLWHLFPMVAYIISVIPYLVRPLSEKMLLSEQIVKDPGFLSIYNFSLFGKLFTNEFLYVGRPLLVLSYTLWAIWMLIRFLKRKEELRVFSHQKFMIKWLSVLLSSTLVLIFSHLFMMIFSWRTNSNDLFFTINSLQVLSAIGLTILMVSPFFFPDILYGLPRFRGPISRALLVEATEMSPEEEIKPRDHNFESNYLVLIDEKMHGFMLEFKPYLQPELNLIRFADILHFPIHHLAYFFREVKRQSFNDYCNECRVEYAKTLMREGKSSDVTLEAVGILSGFTSRSTFFRAFKKFEGISPSSFLSSMTQN